MLAAFDRGSPQSPAALATLCETYWHPVYGYIRRAGHSAEEARDLTQEFFTRVLERDFLRTARPERGRFRAYLLTAVKHFLANERDWGNALKRGGGAPVLSLELDDGERRYRIEAPDRFTPEHVYERGWAKQVLHVAMGRLETAQARAGRDGAFRHLRELAFGEPDQGRYEQVAGDLATTEVALRVAVHRLRRQFGVVLREVIAETVETDEEIEGELRYLLAVVSQADAQR